VTYVEPLWDVGAIYVWLLEIETGSGTARFAVPASLRVLRELSLGDSVVVWSVDGTSIARSIERVS
jgi:hypothetical protein